jgi:ABC-type sugar transport system permease subunit
MTAVDEGLRIERSQRGRRLRRRIADRAGSWMFVVPAVVVVGIFVLYPLGRMVYLSFTDYNGLTDPVFSGLANYDYLLNWPDFRRIIFNTIILLLGIPLWVAGPFLMAVILYGRRSSGWFRAIFLIPALLPPLVIGLIFRIVLSDQGPMNEGLRAVGLGFLAQSWISTDPLVLATIIVVILWGLFGMGVLFYSASLSTVSTETIEAAVLDGANWRQVVWHLLRPELYPAMRFWMTFLALSTVTAFFAWIFTLTRGGPGVASTTLDYAVYQRAFVNGEFGLAAAISVVGVVVLLILVGVFALVGRRGSRA